MPLLLERHHAGAHALDARVVAVHADGREAAVGEAERERQPDAAEADDRDVVSEGGSLIYARTRRRARRFCGPGESSIGLDRDDAAERPAAPPRLQLAPGVRELRHRAPQRVRIEAEAHADVVEVLLRGREARARRHGDAVTQRELRELVAARAARQLHPQRVAALRLGPLPLGQRRATAPR